MKKIFIIGTVLVFLVGIAGCGSSKLTSFLPDQAVESNGQTNVNSGNGEISKQWPSNIGNIPEFTYGDIDMLEKVSETDEGVKFLEYHINYVKVKDGAGEKYSRDLEKAGFKECQPPMENTSPINEVTSTAYEHEKFSFETRDTIYNISVDHWVDSENNGAVIINIPVNPEGGASMDNNNNNEKETANTSANDNGNNEGSEYNWDTLSDSKIPDDYPHKIVPLFGVDGADILGADRQNMGNMGVSYIIIFGVNDELGDVSNEIGAKLKKHAANAGGTFKSLNNQLYMGEINNYKYTVTIGDGKADGYETIVDYTVIHLTK